MLIFVSGPYTKPDPVLNTRKAVKTGIELMRMGHEVVIPHLSLFAHYLIPLSYESWLRNDLAILERCDLVLRLPGESKGADRECARADALNIPIIDAGVDDWRKELG